MRVLLVDAMASDKRVVQSAQVSTIGESSLDSGTNTGLINYLMRERHASPFEHSAYTFLVQAPIFVTREMLRHRTAHFNEESGRYRELSTVFYTPTERPLRQIGKTGDYQFEDGGDLQPLISSQFRIVYDVATEAYNNLIRGGVAKEVARMILPVSTYSTMYVTMNARGLMNFLSLRTAPNAQWEIRQVASQMERYFKETMPITYSAWVDNGRKQL